MFTLNGDARKTEKKVRQIAGHYPNFIALENCRELMCHRPLESRNASRNCTCGFSVKRRHIGQGSEEKSPPLPRSFPLKRRYAGARARFAGVRKKRTEIKRGAEVKTLAKQWISRAEAAQWPSKRIVNECRTAKVILLALVLGTKVTGVDANTLSSS